MIKISENEAAKRLLSSLDCLFHNGQAFLLPHQHLTFVCGARTKEGGVSLRTQFLEYLSANNPENSVLPILAEQAIDEFLGAGVDTAIELGTFENLIADCVDSILIFPESPGSFAELGFFAANPDVLKKTLIANKDSFQGNSFINLGLIPLFNRDSVYKPMIIIGENIEAGFAQVIERLRLKDVAAKYKKRFPNSEFKTQSHKHQIIALYELIRVFGYITEENLFSIIHIVFKSYDLEVVHRLLAILVAINYIHRNEHGDYLIKIEAPGLLQYSDDLFEKAKTQVTLFYRKHDSSASKELGKL